MSIRVLTRRFVVSPRRLVWLCALAGCLVLSAPLVPAAVAAGRCPNEEFRIGRSASLPDCRAYELVTPEELGRTGDMTFFEGDNNLAVVSSDGEHVGLYALGVYLEPSASAEPSDSGTSAVFSRTAGGWKMTSAVTPALTGDHLAMELLSPGFSDVALRGASALNPAISSFLAGPVGGPYSTIASGTAGESQFQSTKAIGANGGTSSVPAFSDVVLESEDLSLLPAGSVERERAEETEPEVQLLYEWSGGKLRLVNVEGEGEHVKLMSRCGAQLGKGYVEGNTVNAVSADGSRVFFVSPAGGSNGDRNGCRWSQGEGAAPQLYMRADGRETVNVSEPEGVSIPLSERGEVDYVGASADGSKVFFESETGLTPDATGDGWKLYEYDSENLPEHRLTLIASDVDEPNEFVNPAFLLSENGSVIYYQGYGVVPGDEGVSRLGIFRYETTTGRRSFVSTTPETLSTDEPAYVTPNGAFLVFPAEEEPSHGVVEFFGPHGFETETRGYEHEELYRYDAATGSVICISCGEGVAPEKSLTRSANSFYGEWEASDAPRGAVEVSEDGQRAFFQTSAKLVPQDTNESTNAEERNGLGTGAEVYEWEEDGTEEAPGVFCEVVNGCTHLISSGEPDGPEHFLGASTNGENVFFTSAAQLVSQATPEFTNIYDARVDGGFAPPPRPVECLSCQGVGSPPLAFSTPASLTFVGAGDQPPPTESATHASTGKATGKARCAKGRKRAHGKCVRAKGRIGGRAKKSVSGKRSVSRLRRGGE
jgi:hypothetical protein